MITLKKIINPVTNRNVTELKQTVISTFCNIISIRLIGDTVKRMDTDQVSILFLNHLAASLRSDYPVMRQNDTTDSRGAQAVCNIVQ